MSSNKHNNTDNLHDISNIMKTGTAYMSMT